MQVMTTEELREQAERLKTFALSNESDLGPVHNVIYIAGLALEQVAENLPALNARCARMIDYHVDNTEGAAAYSSSNVFLLAPLQDVWEAVGGSSDGRWTEASSITDENEPEE
jgi:hypothetical protein